MYIPLSKTVYFLDMMEVRCEDRETPTTLDGIVSDALGVRYSGQQASMISNDTSHKINMESDEDIEDAMCNEGQEPFSSTDDGLIYFDFASWLAAKDTMTETEHQRAAPEWEYALAWCIKNGYLPHGEYVVSVSW